jgi:acetylornithine deacetylase/succinyl-diaminopimelate desuccinylase-like protein
MGLTTKGTWADEVAKRLPSMVALRRLPPPSRVGRSRRGTAQIIAERLSAARLEVKTGIASTGVVGILRGDKPGKTIAWRADIDALPLTEILQAPFTSGTPGVMHACGHDGHTAIAITAAEILAARRAELPGTAVFIFQPAEELLSGAKPMIEAGVLENPHVDEIYSLHSHAGSRGQGQHPAWPHHGVGRQLLHRGDRQGWTRRNASLHRSDDSGRAHPHRHQNLVTKGVAAKETVVLSVGQILAGTKNNIIPDKAVGAAPCGRSTWTCASNRSGRLRSFRLRHGARLSAEARMDLTMGCRRRESRA